ncbi:MAG TPA: glucosamine-6-phosphate deaminase [Bacilli bacterium]|nr:MAG: Glucosamine-6-phosphate deaminase 1 [Tenericutes bacterium ADurb.BinA124]HNZ50568.1 glucosamine-6-phosphate deaminase [Bacilli bacterium]HOH17977.1 glucosamine-6-phosphate deaminase [Bacilli bacterium]HPX84217.1 glucosamine-6-phosphate deaminase [Bacilli bacterium]HQC74449.1 glucosamine-6-phosphate deaminase [Bacilli bacterium]
MKIIKVKNYEELSQKAAQLVAKLMHKKPDATLGLATGSTPIGLYKQLIAMNQEGLISFQQIKTYNLDEYCDLPQSHPQSYYSFMHEHLFDHIDILEENVHLPECECGDLQAAVDKYNQMLKKTTIDLQVLGIGRNGHIGFNEPHTPFDQETFIVRLEEKTRIDNQRFFNSLDEVPKRAITMGIKNIMAAKRILLLISGKSKAETVKKLITSEPSPDFPASVLKYHKKVTVIIDEEAASLL